ncbi:hypothetical protein Trydic_g20846 [Trypoxylus dichotomus]
MCQNDQGKRFVRGSNFPDGYCVGAHTNPSTFSPSSTPGRSQHRPRIYAPGTFHEDELPYPGRENGENIGGGGSKRTGGGYSEATETKLF